MKIFVRFLSITVLMFFCSLSAYADPHLIINEIYYAVEGSGTKGQWIELYNPGPDPVDLGAVTVKIEASGSSSWTGGGAVGFTLSSTHVIHAGEYYLISNSSDDLGSNDYADYVYSSTYILSIPSGFASVRGVRVKINNAIKDALLYGKQDGSSTNIFSLDPTGYYSSGVSPSMVPVVSGVPDGYSLGRNNFLDMNDPSDWHQLSTPSAMSSPPLYVSNTNPAVDEIVMLTRGFPAKGAVKWDFDGNGIVDSIAEDVVLVKYPHNSVVRIAIRAEETLGSASQTITVGNAGTAAAEILIDNNDAYINPATYGSNTSGGYAHIGAGYWVDDNIDKGNIYYEYPVTVPSTGYYDITLSVPFEGTFANNVPVEIVSTGHDTFTAIFDQSLNSYTNRPYLFTTVKTVFFLAGQTHYVRIKNDGTTATVAADACKVVRAGVWEKDNDGVYVFEDMTDIEDTDNDSIPDGWEIAYNLNPLVDDASDDGDSDGLDNAAEYAAHTDPTNPDSDGDGRNDGQEVADGTDPTTPDALITIEMEAIARTAQGYKITWTYEAGNTYNVYWSDSIGPDAVWDQVNYFYYHYDFINNGNGTMSWNDIGLDAEMNGVSPHNATHRFYKVTVTVP